MDNQIAIDSVMGSLLWFGKILGVALLAPILEESIFRASIYKIFSNNKIAFVFPVYYLHLCIVAIAGFFLFIYL